MSSYKHLALTLLMMAAHADAQTLSTSAAAPSHGSFTSAAAPVTPGGTTNTATTQPNAAAIQYSKPWENQSAAKPSAPPVANAPAPNVAKIIPPQTASTAVPRSGGQEGTDAAVPARRAVHSSRELRAYSRRSYSRNERINADRGSYASDYFDFRYTGDLGGALGMLRELQPGLSIIQKGDPVAADVDVDLSRATVGDVISSIGEEVGEKASISYDAKRRLLRVAFFTPKDKEGGDSASGEAKRWQDGQTARPVFQGDGMIQYPFGMTQPTLTCSPLHACDFELEQGENINNVVMGDSVRWIAAPAKSGSGMSATQHIILKPSDTGLNTNMIVTTDKRTYFVTLKSSATRYQSRVGFYYPDQMVQKWHGDAMVVAQKVQVDAQRVISDMPSITVDNLNLDGYKIKGNRALDWYPVRVFDDGAHIYIQMPEKSRASDAPSLVIETDEDKAELVNYRVKTGKIAGRTATYYIVDKLFHRAALLMGVDDEQQKVVITREAH